MNVVGRTIYTLSLLAALVGGCVGADGQEETRSDVGNGSGEDADDWDGAFSDEDTDDEPRLPPFSRPFDGLVQNTARWAIFEVATKAARVERGMDEDWVDGEPEWGSIDVNTTYAELDLDLTNTTMFDEALDPRDTWDLILSDGTRIEQSNVLAFMAGPRGSSAFTLRYAIDETVDLAGAALELNGTVRGELAPERIPLDAPYRADIDAVLTALQGKTFESARPMSIDQRRIEIVEARVSRNNSVHEERQRSISGKIFVALTLDLTPTRRDNVFDDDFGIVVDGKLSRPVNSIVELPDAGTTLRMPVIFEIDDTAKAFTVRLRVGWDSDLTPEVEWKDVEVAW